MITDIIKYFAKFPERDSVMKLFSRKDSSSLTGYEDLKAEMLALPAALLPELQEYICSTDAKILATRIRNVKNYFLLLEYGAISASGRGRSGTRETEFALAVTVGRPYSEKETDAIEEAMIMEKCLSLLVRIAEQMEQDNRNQTCGFLQLAPGNIDIQPVEPALMFGCLGWTMTFGKLENNLL